MLPDGGAVITREAWKALRGLPFRYFPTGEDEDVQMEAVPINERDYFLSIYTRSEAFGLPNGGGWADEPDWIIRLLENMKHKRAQIEAWLSRGRK